MQTSRTCYPRLPSVARVEDAVSSLASQQVEALLEELRQLRASVAVYRHLVDRLSENQPK